MRFIKDYSGQLGQLSYEKDIPFPDINLLIYYDIYYAEQWLRRILFSVLLMTYGEEWLEKILPDIRNDLSAELKKSKGKIYLDCENSPNLIWLTTLEQLKRILLSEPLWPILKKFTKISQAELKKSIDTLRTVRNVIGHNRAATMTTWHIFSAGMKTIHECIGEFKSKFFSFSGVRESSDWYEGSDDKKNQTIFPYFNRKQKSSGCDVVLLEKEYTYSLFVKMPKVFGPEACTNISRLLDEFRDVESSIICFLVSFIGTEYEIVWPKNALPEPHFRIIDLIFELYPDIWIEKPLIFQDPKYICHPKIWIFDHDKIIGQNEKITDRNDWIINKGS